MNTESRTKQAVRLTPKDRPADPAADNHAAVVETYRQHAARITREAVERYLQAMADVERVYADRDAVDALLPKPSREQVTGQVPLTDEERSRFEESQAWEQFYEDTVSVGHAALDRLLRAILRWDSSLEIGEDLVGHPARGVIHKGVLYLATPEDPYDFPKNSQAVLHVVPLASVVDLDTFDWND